MNNVAYRFGGCFNANVNANVNVNANANAMISQSKWQILSWRQKVSASRSSRG
jgi:hypothetical protein